MANYHYRIIHYIVDYIVQITLLIISYILDKKIFIIARPYGRWGNRLMLFSYIQCWAKKNNCIVFNPSFEEYAIYFKNFQKNKIAWIPEKKIITFIFSTISELIIQSLTRSTYRRYILPKVSKIDLENDHRNFSEDLVIKNILSNFRIILFYGFLFGKRDFGILREERQHLRLLFQMNKEITCEYESLRRKIKSNKIIGVCMRQGDYKEYSNGKYYLTDEDYLSLISKLKKIFSSSFDIFVACEENKTNLDSKSFFISFGNPALNLYTLSKCDLLIGPPSTFMTWAAFLNDTPVCYIDKFSWNRKDYIFESTSF